MSKPYTAMIVRPTVCCNSSLGVGDVVEVQYLEPAERRKWYCRQCGAWEPAGEVMAILEDSFFSRSGVPAYRLAKLPPPEEVTAYDERERAIEKELTDHE